MPRPLLEDCLHCGGEGLRPKHDRRLDARELQRRYDILGGMIELRGANTSVIEQVREACVDILDREAAERGWTPQQRQAMAEILTSETTHHGLLFNRPGEPVPDLDERRPDWLDDLGETPPF